MISCNLFAQLKADFKADNTSGCIPLIVSFTNTTTGASNAATYKWDFGNSNSASTKDAATTYTTGQNYTVTLTVTDNNITSSKSMIITVFKNPAPSFSVDHLSGCTPFVATFNSTSVLETGSAGVYYWDFGDGTTLDFNSANQTVSHNYITSGVFSVKFQVKSNNGCAASLLIKNNLINANSKPLAAYSRSKAFLCKAGDNITFTNNTNSQGATYLWKFGDGTTSTDLSPTHTYLSAGVFSDSLIVTSSLGCFDTTFSPNPIYSANFHTDFSIPNTGLCAGNTINFTNSSSPVADVSNWYISGQTAAISGLNASKVFTQAGNYTVKLVNLYGSCLDSTSKTVTILPGFSVKGFVVSSAPLCAGKTLVTLTDTSNATSTLWNLQNTPDTVTTNPALYTFAKDSTYKVSLTVSNAFGCSSVILQTLTVTHAPVNISSTSSNPLNNTSGCPGLKVHFFANPSTNIKTYTWSFGDSITTSSEPSPIHTYDSVGSFTVKLNYETLDGCSDSAFLRNIITFSRPFPAFICTNLDQCGGSKQFIDNTPLPVTAWFWYFGDSLITGNHSNSISHIQDPKHFFSDTGYYDIKLIATNGTCSDSVTYPQYVYIKAPIAHSDSVIYSCLGDRSTVVFWNSYKYVVSGTWDFGDNSPLVAVDTSVHFIAHQFPSTKLYNVVLTTTNATCTPKDTLWIPVLKKQHPFLSSFNITSICENDSLKVDLDSLERNPSSLRDSNYYSIFRWQYGDATIFSKGLNIQRNWFNTYLGTVKGLLPGKTDLRVITQSVNFGCLDTSNYIPLMVKGPVAGYYINSPKSCFKQPLTFTDTSKTNFGVPIARWEWRYGDKTIDTLNKGGSVTHSYLNPARYLTSLKVTDTDGCFNISQKGDTAFPSGPKANFYWTPTYIITGTTANFINSTNTFGDRLVNYIWTFFSDSSTASTTNTTHAYTTAEKDSVQLIAINPQNNCRDTIAYPLMIKRVFAVFTLTTKYSDVKNTCPPMQAVFTSHSVNADRLRWDFGDGSGKAISKDTFASHTYDQPGIYTVWLYAYKNSSLLDSTSQTIVVKGAYAKVISDLTQGCIPATINLKSNQFNTATFTWDFGDGTVIVNSPDSFVTHQYVSAGVFTPHILLKDINGCNSSFPSQKPIIVDSLHPSFSINKLPVCDSGTVLFTPHVISFSADSLSMPLSYHWTFDTGKVKNTSNSALPSFNYKTLGSYLVTQTITSAIGCVATYTDSVFVKPSSRGIIKAPATTCEGLPVTFTATQSYPGDVRWHWKFNNGDTSILQNPLPEIFKSAKDSIIIDTIQLVTMLNNCYDTTPFYLRVNPFPRVNLLPKFKQICEGDTVNLTAYDGNRYEWSPGSYPFTKSTINVKLFDTTTFYVKVTNALGCTNTDSSIIGVTPEIKKTLLFPRDTFVCKGLSVQLPVRGADNYLWLKDSATLTNYANNSSNPTATPVVSPTIYQFVAWNGSCSHDTEKINVVQIPYPTISTRDTLTMFTGTSAVLSATVSPDVINYHWSPSDYLNNTDTSSPTCTPKNDLVYTVSVSNSSGCTVRDSISIHLLCSESLFVPSGFIPSSNYLDNNIFYPKGQGLKEILYFRVYNRGGELLFEKTHFQPNDKAFGWDGIFQGKKESVGTYVFTIKAQCDTGEFFEKKGTIVLIR